jgi:hypothetical protein
MRLHHSPWGVTQSHEYPSRIEEAQRDRVLAKAIQSSPCTKQIIFHVIRVKHMPFSYARLPGPSWPLAPNESV